MPRHVAAPAWKAAQDVAEGYLSLNPVTLKKYQSYEMDALQKEIEKLSRELRSTVVSGEDTEAVQAKNRKLLRLSQATVILQSYRSRRGL